MKPGGPIGGIPDAVVNLRFVLAQRPLELGFTIFHYSKTSIAAHRESDSITVRSVN